MVLPDCIDIEMVVMTIGNVWMRLFYNDITDDLEEFFMTADSNSSTTSVKLEVIKDFAQTERITNKYALLFS